MRLESLNLQQCDLQLRLNEALRQATAAEAAKVRAELAAERAEIQHANKSLSVENRMQQYALELDRAQSRFVHHEVSRVGVTRVRLSSEGGHASSAPVSRGSTDALQQELQRTQVR